MSLVINQVSKTYKEKKHWIKSVGKLNQKKFMDY